MGGVQILPCLIFQKMKKQTNKNYRISLGLFRKTEPPIYYGEKEVYCVNLASMKVGEV